LQKVKNENSGFTLIEIVLAMVIVAITFTGIYMSLAKNSQHEKDNRVALIAANLAQEGVEMIRNRRDENILEDWNDRDSGGSGMDMNEELSSGDCYPYWSGNQAECDGSKRAEVEIDGNGIYRNCDSSGCSGQTTIFERTCDITTSNSTVIEVVCEVTWESPSLGTNRSIEVESYLTNWEQNL